MRVIRAEAIAGEIRALTNRADMILKGIDQIPLSDGEIEKFKMRLSGAHI